MPELERWEEIREASWRTADGSGVDRLESQIGWLCQRIAKLERIAAAARDLIDYEDHPETGEHGRAVYLHWDAKFGALRRALGGGQ